MNLVDDVRLAEYQQIVVAFDITRVVFEPRAAIVRLLEVIALDHGAHGPIQNQDALL